MSPSGEYSLLVNPSNIHGMGKGHYTLRCRGDVVWSGDLPYSFWDAAVTDSGMAAGFAYSHGFQGRGASDETFGDLIVALINSDGTERSRETTPRKAGHGWSCPPDRQPSPRGCFVQPELGLFVVRLDGSEESIVARGERWVTYSVQDGTRAGERNLVSPPHGDGRWYLVMDVDAVPGTDLSLVAWCRTQWRPGDKSDHGCRLSLVDNEAKEIWSREWETEFAGIRYFDPWSIKESDITPADRFGPGRFVYLSHGAQAALSFAVRKGGDGLWQVEDLGSVPQVVRIGRDPDPDADAGDLTAKRQLELLGQVSLGGAPAQPSLDIMNFAFDDQGRCGFVRMAGDLWELVVLDPAAADPIKSALHIATGLKAEEGHMPPAATWVGQNRWVIVRGCYRSVSEPAPTRAWFVDAGTREVTPVADFDCPAPRIGRAVVSAGELGFLVIGSFGNDSITRFESSGRKRWSKQIGYGAQDVSIRADGSLGVLVGLTNVIQVLDPDGHERQTIDLDTAFGSRPNYVVGLETDENSGWIVHDFGGSPSVYRLDERGSKRAAFSPHHPDGRVFSLRGDVRRAPDGRMWTSDGAALFRLDQNGVVDRVVGPSPDTDALDEVAAVAVDAAGRIYVLDARTARTHVFDRAGHLIRVLRPDPKDFASRSDIGQIAVAGDGAVYARPSRISLADTRHLKFDHDGNRVGFEERRGPDRICDEWYFRPGGQELLSLGAEKAYLFDAAGDLVQSIERRADDQWLVHPEHASVAPDGSFAILSNSDGATVTVYSPRGDPLKTFWVPNRYLLSQIALSNSSLVVVGKDSVYCIDRATGRGDLFSLPTIRHSQGWLKPFFSPEGSEIWIVETHARRLDRYAVPGMVP